MEMMDGKDELDDRDNKHGEEEDHKMDLFAFWRI